jgi:hypothetical protein
LLSLLLQDIALANHAIFFDVVMHPFTVEFEPKQALWVVADVHGRVVVGLLQTFSFCSL